MAHLDITPWEPEETVGKLWHRLAARMDPPARFPEAAVRFDEMRGRMQGVFTVVVAGDMPYAAAAVPVLVAALAGAGEEVEAAVGVDDDGHANPLLAAYRTSALRAALPEPAHGTAAKRLLTLPHVRVPMRGLIARDVDTPADLGAFSAGRPAERSPGAGT